nr:MAG TPA: hypothetical protein [Bacteriophage sp.]
MTYSTDFAILRAVEKGNCPSIAFLHQKLCHLPNVE